MNNFFVIGLVILSTIISGFASIFLKKGSAKLSRNIFKQIKNYELIFGLFLFLFATVFYVWALKQADLSLIYPITSFTYIWVALLSVYFLKEQMTLYKLLGIIFIIGGVFLITI